MDKEDQKLIDNINAEYEPPKDKNNLLMGLIVFGAIVCGIIALYIKATHL